MGLSTLSAATLAANLMLVSPWKPLLLVATLGAWGWLVATIYDKHAAQWRLNRENWGLAHLSAGFLAIALALAIPLQGELAFWIGWVVMIAVLAIDLVMYPQIANKDERVPKQHRVTMATVLGPLAGGRGKSKKSEEKGPGEVRLTLRLPDKSVLPAPAAESPDLAARIAAEDLFFKTMAARGSQVDLVVASKDSYKASMLVDGVRQDGDTLPAPVAIKVIDVWKSAAKLDVNERRKKCSGDTTAEMGSSKWKVRVQSVGVQGGMRLTLLLEPEKAVKRKADALGLLPEQMAELQLITGQTTKFPDETPVPETVHLGVVLLGGPPDAGRSTTVFSVLGMHDAYTNSIQTMEMEAQANIEGIKHTIFDPNVEGADFSTSVRSILRRDPDVVAVAEMPDANTAKEVAKVDAERSRVYLSMNAANALETIDKYVKAVGDPATAAKALRGVLSQKLIRKLCSNCKVGYPPTPDMLKKMGVGAGEKVGQLFKKGGQVIDPKKGKEPVPCPQCGGSGYNGQCGVFEVYRIGDEERKLIEANDLNGLKAALRKTGLPTLQQAAIRKAIMGESSVEEVQRATASAAPAAAAPVPPTASVAPPKSSPAKQ